MQWLLVMHQENGCDYMIACGTRVEEFTCASMETAIVHAEKRVGDLSHRECTIAWARLYFVKASDVVNIDVASVREKAMTVQEIMEREDDERAEYERLRRKFGD